MLANRTFYVIIPLKVVALTDVVDNLISPASGGYKGNVLSDAYLAFWKLSNDFYTSHVLESSCGNFGTNLTAPYGDNCNGIVVGTHLSGRDITLLQKKYFGGVAMTAGFYHWATTKGAKLSALISKSPDVFGRRQGRHYISCGGDAMFHVNKGVRCAFSDRNLHSRMPLDPTHVRLKRTRV
jgi:hypothetical protein